MAKDFLDDLDELYSRTRQYEFNGHKFILECRDPYGFWYIGLKNKKTPKDLLDAFTNISAAINRCKWWAESQPPVPAQEEAAEIRRKRVTDKTK